MLAGPISLESKSWIKQIGISGTFGSLLVFENNENHPNMLGSKIQFRFSESGQQTVLWKQEVVCLTECLGLSK